MTLPIYLDYNGTTPLAPAVIAAMRPFLESEFGNPSSAHWYGIAPKKAVQKARAQVADLLGTDARAIRFTSGGTEANNHAILGTAYALKDKGRHIITSQVEHAAVLEVCRFLQRQGYRVSYLPSDETGQVDPDDVEDAIRPDTVLITIMHANNELGTLEPIQQIGEIAGRHSIRLHTDAAQSVGKMPVDVNELGVDLLSLAGHKLYAPKGVGALFVRGDIPLENLMHGAGQETGQRPGTENVAAIVGLGAACELAHQELRSRTASLAETRDRLEAELKTVFPKLRVNGHPKARLPNTLNVTFPGIDAERLLEAIGLEVAASAGAACHSDQVSISHVLKAIGLSEAQARSTLRFSTGKMTTQAEIDQAASAIQRAIQGL